MKLYLLVLAVLLLPGAAASQDPIQEPRRPPAVPDTTLVNQPVRPQPGAPGNDTTVSDSSQAQKEIVQWAETDSVMDALLSRPGYTPTRYQGKQAVFDADSRVLELSGSSAVQREQATLIADTIVYDDATKLVRAAAAPKDTIILRDPTQGQADLVALGGMEYDLIRRRGVVRDLSTSSSQLGQTWYVHGDRAA